MAATEMAIDIAFAKQAPQLIDLMRKMKCAPANVPGGLDTKKPLDAHKM